MYLFGFFEIVAKPKVLNIMCSFSKINCCPISLPKLDTEGHVLASTLPFSATYCDAPTDYAFPLSI